MSPKDWEGKAAIITGGASGIGLALGKAMASQGVNVVLCGRNAIKGTSAVQQLQGNSGKVSFVKVDVTDASAVESMVEATIQKYGKLNFMINNAGIGIAGEARDVDLTNWRKVIDINLMGVIHGVLSAYPRMIAQHDGHIVNISSVGGFFATPAMGPYNASKFGVSGLTQGLRAEAKYYGVRVTLVCPPMVQTDMFETAEVYGFDRQVLYANMPGGMMQPDECAKIILKGMARNQAVIMPGSARVIASLHRFLPFLTNSIAADLGRKIAEGRAVFNSEVDSVN